MQTLRYDDLGTVNAVKILPKINIYNGYIQLTTELDSHIEEGDIVFISYSGNPTTYPDSEILLDNYIYTKISDHNIYSEFSTGYMVINVNKNNNTFVINRKIETIPANKELNDHYVSKISINNANINNGGEIDSTFIRSAEIFGNNLIWKQGVMYNGNITNLNIINKYDDNYISLKVEYNIDFVKYLTLNNNNYGYSYFFNMSSSIKNSDIDFGIFNNCRIKSTNTPKSNIRGGYFYDCVVLNNKITNGYFEKTTLNNCDWIYGKWNSTSEFNTLWKNGIFLNGVFSQDYTWENGTFIDGVFKGIWKNGDFNGGIFSAQTNSIWEKGNFNGGILSGNSNINVYNCDLNGGVIENSIISYSNLKNGEINNSTIKKSNILTVKIKNSDVFDNNYVSGLIEDTNVFNSVFNSNDITIKKSNFYFNNKINNGKFENNNFKNGTIINNGNFYNNLFDIDNDTIQQCKIKTITLLSGTTEFKQVIYAELIDGTHFTTNDIGSVILFGFENDNLNTTFTIPQLSTYNDPTSYNGSFSVFPSIGQNYVLLGEVTENYSDEIGIIKKTLSENTSLNIINNGYFEKDEFLNTIINNGEFVNTFMHSATTFNNGNFKGGTFYSTQTEQNNIWIDGNFYNGDFGLNNNNNKDIYAIIDDANTEIVSDSSSSTTSIVIDSIYPRLFDTSAGGQTISVTISSSTMLNYEAWVDESTSQIIALPYELIFKIKCNNNKVRVITWLDNSNNIVSIVDLDKTTSNPLNGSGNIYKSFNDIYDNGYIYKYYYNEQNTDFIYLIFQSEKIKILYYQSHAYEENSYNINYKNMWSVANTGYYTHPLPVLTSSEDNTSAVTNYKISGNDTDWIYGTSVPPWILKIDYQGSQGDIHYVDWSLLSGSSTYTIDTPANFNGSSIDNYTLDINNFTTPNILKNDLTTLHTEYLNMKNSSLNTPYNNSFLDWMSYHTLHRNDSGDTSFGCSGSTYDQSHQYIDIIENWSGETAGWVFHPNQQGPCNDGNLGSECTWVGETSSTISEILKIPSVDILSASESYLLEITHLDLVADIIFVIMTNGYPLSNSLGSINTTNSNGIPQTSSFILNGYNDWAYIEIRLNSQQQTSFYTINEASIKRIKNLSEFPSEYVVSNTGITNYGVPMKKIDEVYTDDKIIKQGDSLYNINIQDTLLFESYYKYRKNYYTTLQSSLMSDSIINKYYHNDDFTSNDFTEQDKLEFQRWNQNLQTSTVNFERKAGIQMKTINQNLDISTYHDNFSGGTFYNGNFYGIWEDGKWANGDFFGWNGLISPTGVTSLTPPNTTNPDTIAKISTYHKNIEYLKSKNKYYEIPPWVKNKK